MKITIEICCDEAFGERRGDKLDKALDILGRLVEEAKEHAGMLSDPEGVERQEIYGPGGETCGFLKVEG